MSATVISHYRLLNPLGEGGMGVVYRAEDTRLGREVAVKLLRTDTTITPEWLARFEREARLASSLQHPHICTIHELGEHEGQPFIVMELLEGRTIRQLVENGPLAPRLVLEFARQIASALDAAHRRGIIHRDIKPANLFVTHGERLKVLDFGLAKLTMDEAPAAGPSPSTPTLTADLSPDLTRTGSTVGTASYMAPEQAQGQPVDARTDLFSLGSVLYEMSTGRRAFGGDDVPFIVMRIINGIVVPPRAINEAVPEHIDTIIQKLMAVDPSERYQSASDLLTDIATATEHLALLSKSGKQVEVGRPEGGARGGGGSWLRRRGLVVAAAAVALITAGVAGTWVTRKTSGLTDRDSVMIGRFENTTSDPDFDETLLTAVKAHLGQSPFLDIVPDQRIAEALQLMARRPGERLTHAVAREVCQRLGLKAMLEGSVAPLGSHYVVALVATDCQTGEPLARAQAEAPGKERVLTELGTISSSIRTSLGESLPSIQRFAVPIEQVTTPSLAALKAYTVGLEERRRGRELESIAFFNQAIENDPEFAAAYTTLSAIYGGVGETRRAEEYARLAFNVKRRVSERERLFITYQYHDRATGNQDEAARTLEIWKTAYPRDSRPVNALALIYHRLGKYDRAVAEAQEALRRSPGHPFPLSNLAIAYRALGQYDAAKKTAEQAVKLGIETTPTRRVLYQLGLLTGDGSAAAHLAWAKGKPREFDLVSAQAQVAAFGGQMREAVDLYQRARDLAQARGLDDAAAGFVSHIAWTMALYQRKEAGASVRHLLGEEKHGNDVPGLPRFRSAVAYGLVGLTAEAQALIAATEQRYPEATLVRTLLTPVTRAAVALYRSRPDEAIDALRAASPTERGTVAGLVPIFLRGEAYTRKGSFAEALRQYELIVSHRGVDPFAPIVPLAQLGVARAKARLGDAGGSRRAYEELFTIWKSADADFAPLLAARTEYERLQTNNN